MAATAESAGDGEDFCEMLQHLVPGAPQVESEPIESEAGEGEAGEEGEPAAGAAEAFAGVAAASGDGDDDG